MQSCLMSAIHRPPGRGGPCPGIIPARAGFTSNPRTARPDAPDHPRSRGVYLRKFDENEIRWGSSPLARGLQRPVPGAGHRRGIIPARAGFTSWATTTSRWREDHPRSRGVYPGSARPHMVRRGSSPLARGLRVDHERRLLPARIIPARAGFTRGPRTPTSGRSDHPRSRGVYHVSLSLPSLFPGSSPLARGLQ